VEFIRGQAKDLGLAFVEEEEVKVRKRLECISLERPVSRVLYGKAFVERALPECCGERLGLSLSFLKLIPGLRPSPAA
jgi:hypothetical protein